jgi:hypothetical protein
MRLTVLENMLVATQRPGHPSTTPPGLGGTPVRLIAAINPGETLD